MASSRADRREGGFVTPAFVAAVGLTTLLLVGAANQYAVHFARGVMQTAAEEAARQGRATGAADRCRDRAADAVEGLLGAMADHVRPPVCAAAPDRWAVELRATFPAWLPGLPATTVVTTATAAGTTPITAGPP